MQCIKIKIILKNIIIFQLVSAIFCYFSFSESRNSLNDFNDYSVDIRADFNRNATERRLINQIPKLLKRTLGHNWLPEGFSIAPVKFEIEYPRFQVDGAYFPGWKNDATSEAAEAQIVIHPDLLKSPNDFETTIIHEFFHHLHYQFRPNEADWIKEGLAIYMSYLVTGLMPKNIFQAYSGVPISLIEIPVLHERRAENLSFVFAHYGELFLYFHYLFQNCGHDILFKKIMGDRISTKEMEISGIDFINRKLVELVELKNQKFPSVCESFEKSFIGFQKAKFFPRATSRSTYILPGSLKGIESKYPGDEDLPPWSARLYSISDENSKNCRGILLDDKHCFEIQLQKGNFLKE